MLPKLHINFVDFWATFDKCNNLFYRVLSEKYEVIISEDPDILFFSCYGWEYLNYKCIKIFYTAENKKVDFTAADYGISFESSGNRHQYRLPFYAYRILSDELLEKLLQTQSLSQAKKNWNEKKKFTCMIISNPGSPERINFFHKLNNVKKVDSGGLTLNNIGERIYDKMEFISQYKFVLSFENESSHGYLTEKLVDGLLSGGIPLYWGDPSVHNVFNEKRFLNLDNYPSEEKFIDEILNIANNKNKYINILQEPAFRNNNLPEELKLENFKAFLFKCVEESKNKKPVTITFNKYIHLFKIKLLKLKKKRIFFLRKINSI